MKTEVIHARIEPALKAAAEKILRKLCISTSYAISLFFSQIVMHNGIPFDVTLSKKTKKTKI
jgi:DNA-damage-inducible protein J